MHKHINKAGLLEEVSLQCMGPSSELRHCNSSTVSVALCPAYPQQKTSHTSCQQGTRTHLNVFSTARWKEESRCRRGEDDSKTGHGWCQGAWCNGFLCKVRNPATLAVETWCASFHVMCESCLQLQGWWWQTELLSYRTLQQLGQCQNLLRSKVTLAPQYYRWFPWQHLVRGKGIGKWWVNTDVCIFAWCWSDSPGKKPAVM